MINPCEAIYDGDNIEDAQLGVLEFRSPGGTIKAAYIYVKENVSDDAVFNITKNNAALWTLADRLTILDGENESSKIDLNIVTTRGDRLQLDLEECPADGVASPITLILEIDDGVEAGTGGASDHGALTGLDSDDHPQYFNQTRGDARYVQSSTLIETVQDTVGAMLTAGAHALINYDDAAGTVSIASVQLTQEEIQDYVGAFLSAGANTTVTYNDAGNVLVIGETSAGLSTEQIQDMLATFLAAGLNVTLTYDDAGNSLAIAASGGGGTTLPSQTGNAGKFLKTDGTTASWDTPAGGASYTGGRPTDPIANFFERFEFLNYEGFISSSSIPLNTGWAYAGNVAYEAGDANHPGLVRLYTNDAGFPCTMIRAIAGSVGNKNINAASMWEINAIVRVGNPAARVFIGLSDFDDNFNFKGVGFFKDTNDTNWYAYARSAGGGTLTKQSVAAFAAATWYRLRIRRIDAATIGFSVNDSAEISVTANLPTGLLFPYMLLRWISGTFATLDVDYWDMSITNLARY